MSSYSKSIETKETIINLACKYFWEKGFEQTRYGDLSDSGINPGLIHYYFKSKEALACVVYNRLVEQCSALILQILDCSNDTLYRAVACATVIWKYLESSQNFKRFYSEIANRRIPIQDALEEDIYFIKDLNKEYQLNRNDSEIVLLNRICSSISNELVISFSDNLTSYSTMELAEYEIKSVFRVIGIDKKFVDKAIKKSKEVFIKYEFYMEEDFKMCFRPINVS